MNLDLIYALTIFAGAGAVSLAYGIRVFFKGQAHFERVERQGGSVFLNKAVMELGYWFFQPFARALVACRITANQISVGSFAFGVLAGCSLAFGHFGFGAGFAAISGAMDSLDGMVARLTSKSSNSGEVLDASVDRYVEFFFLGGLIVYYREIPALLILSLLALVGSFMVSYSSAKAEALAVEPPKGSMRRPERAVYLTLGAALSPLSISWFEVGRDYSVAMAHPMIVALSIVAVASNFSAIERLWVMGRLVNQRDQGKIRTGANAGIRDEVESLRRFKESENYRKPSFWRC